MLIVFKKNEISFKNKLVKLISILLIFAVGVSFCFNTYLDKCINNAKQELNLNKSKVNKYLTLLKVKNKSKLQEQLNSSIIKKIAYYNNKLILDYIELKNKKLLIVGKTANKKYIFNFLNKLTADTSFNNCELRSLKQLNIFIFKISADLG
ncbi:hypothetical protein [Halanaerobium salsuginis]|jgi:hypothetical protein|uniref:Fimbrial assembly protein (PilN) n=1 Tax=Halanaerobium salsuginis TaxID=29563 RepID=A0A1I4EX49_9FIRM|nr:hypothetical protein [Halanaerobium salsuginis]SFL09077.1 hypothetical protein SAMN02983006_00146 [Halanaerobium salsuginis]